MQCHIFYGFYLKIKYHFVFRFIPEGIYLDALSLGPKELAKRMSEIINDTYKYSQFFKWHGYYTFHLSSDDMYQREVCGLCELLNNNVLMNQTTIVRNITQWWNEESPVLNATSNIPKWGDEDSFLDFILDEEEDTSVKGFVSQLYNLVFG